MPKITWICENGHEIELEMTSFEIKEPVVCDKTLFFDNIEIGVCGSMKFTRQYKPPALSFRGAGFYTTDNPKE